MYASLAQLCSEKKKKAFLLKFVSILDSPAFLKIPPDIPVLAKKEKNTNTENTKRKNTKEEMEKSCD